MTQGHALIKMSNPFSGANRPTKIARGCVPAGPSVPGQFRNWYSVGNRDDPWSARLGICLFRQPRRPHRSRAKRSLKFFLDWFRDRNERCRTTTCAADLPAEVAPGLPGDVTRCAGAFRSEDDRET